MIKKAIYGGSFDPFTNGHLNIVERGLKIFDEIIIAVSYNEHKQTLFTIEERVELIKKSVTHLKNVKIIVHSGGLMVNLAEDCGAIALLKGIRNETDALYEQSMALYGKRANQNIEVVTLFSDEEHQFLSSSGVKEFYRTGGDVSQLVNEAVKVALSQKIKIEKVHFDYVTH